MGNKQISFNFISNILNNICELCYIPIPFVLVFKHNFSIFNRGLPGERSVPFREWFGNLGELSSLIPEKARMVVVTATKTTRVKIFDTLHLGPETVMVEKSPDRPNLKYSAIYITKSMPFEQILASVIR